MIIKKFQARSETEAIMLAKEELGKDAIVMNIKSVKPKGVHKMFQKPVVEVTAAIDDNISYNNEKFLSKIKEISQNTKPVSKDIIIEEPEKEESEENAIEKKLNNLQVLLEQQMSVATSEKQTEEKEQDEKNSKNKVCIQLIFDQLVKNEVDEKYANQIISEIEKSLKKDATVDNILGSIYQKIILKLGQPNIIQLKEDQTKYIFFIGPTGVGKTTTIAKIASSFKLNQKSKIALVTSDTYRIAAVEQLRTYANILGIPLKVVYSDEEMKLVKEDFEGYDLVLIDTAGRSHNNQEQKNDIKNLMESIPENEREIYLVLSATTKYNDLRKITEAYSEITNYNLLFTKLDETSCIGNVLNIKMFTGAPLSYATWGQNVPDDIGRIDAQNIAKRLLRGE
jgi:flagellar biosynthetic protein FlhF